MRRTAAIGRRLAWALLALAAGCEKSSEKSPAPGAADIEQVVAEYRLGTITGGDVDRFILALPPDRRRPQGDDAVEWYAGIARRIAVDRLLLDEAQLVGADQDPLFQAREREIERSLYSQRYLSRLPAEDPLTGDELRAFFERHQDRYRRPERRTVAHLYKRFGPDRDRQAATAELAELRRRAAAGEGFGLLARRHSDSETRHRDGLLGTFERGRLSEDFDRVVFALEEGVVSQPVATRDGMHLFLVHNVLEERSFTFEEVRAAIFRELETERRRERLQRAAAGLPQPEGLFVPQQRELVQLLRAGDPGTVLLRLGDLRLTVAEFREILFDRHRTLGGRQVPDLPVRLLQEIRDQEIIYQHLRAAGLPEIPHELIEAGRSKQLAEHFARRKMTSWIERRHELVQRHYEDNRMRFASPLKVRLRRLTVPLGDDPPTRMARLEAAKPALDAGAQGLEELAARLGGEVDDLGLVSAARLQATDPRVQRFAFLLEPGQHSPPYRRDGSLVMFQVTERQEPEPRPLALVRGQVVEDYLTHRAAAVFEEVSDQLLAAAGFRIDRDRLAAIGARPRSSG